ncbi:uncharacterized protein [Clytia hemisphaerica]
MVSPAARNCMWRYGWGTPKNYDDNQLWCGGAWKMAALGGKCGVCGDTADQTNQPHADGGRFAKGIIVKKYRAGQVIDVDINLSTAHYGYFEFRIGQFDNRKVVGDRYGKLQGHLLPLVSGGTRFKVPDNIRGARYNIKLRLPSGLRCRRCVLQWWYKGGNNWGCENGKCGMGKGVQEHFVNCADVSVQ